MIPAKLGSTRLPAKNLALLDGKPLIYYAIRAAKESRIFDRIIVNAEDALFEKISKRYKTEFYLRPLALVGPGTKTDEVVYDFILKNPCDIVAWVSPIAPLQPASEIREIVKYFIKKRLDSLMTVKDEQVHCLYRDRPVNFNLHEIFSQTQDLIPVRAFVYSLMMWRTEVFKREFDRKGYALLAGKLGFFSVSKESAVIIKRKEDLILADNLVRAMKRKRAYAVKYDRIIGR